MQNSAPYLHSLNYSLNTQFKQKFTTKIKIDTEFELHFDRETFVDPDGDPLQLSLHLTAESIDDQLPIPPWIVFDQTSYTIQGKPPGSEMSKTYSFTLTVTDGYFKIYDQFSLHIYPSTMYILQKLLQIICSLTILVTVYSLRYQIFEILCKKRYRLKNWLEFPSGEEF